MTDQDTPAAPFPVPFHKTWLHQAFASAKTKASSHMYQDMADAHPEVRVSVLWRMVTYCPLSGAKDVLYMDWINLWYAAVLDLLDLNQEEPGRSVVFINHLLRGPLAVLEGSHHDHKKNPKARKLFMKILLQSWIRANDGLSAMFIDVLLHLAEKPEMTSAVANALRHGDYRHDRYHELNNLLMGMPANSALSEDAVNQLMVAIDYAAFSSLGSKGRKFFGEMVPHYDALSEEAKTQIMAVIFKDEITREVSAIVSELLHEKFVNRLGGIWAAMKHETTIEFDAEAKARLVTVNLRLDSVARDGMNCVMGETKIVLAEGDAPRRLRKSLDVNGCCGRINFLLTFGQPDDGIPSRTWTV